MNLLPGFEIDQEVDVTFRGVRVTDVGTNFIDVETADGEELCVLPGASSVDVTPAGNVPTLVEFHTLLEAIREALTTPARATHNTPLWTEPRAREWLLIDRIAEVNGVISNILAGRLTATTGVAWWAELLRSRVEQTPVTYPAAEQSSPSQGSTA
ncbi:hypothetical protein AB0J28_09560 [Streptosporangium canum]|uniref:hypothetical protein n=1 Tax=Streptosporangium canum TaxID=324952 RepID=UPI00344A5C59